LYSASVLEHDMVFCLFAHQDIKLGLKKIAKPPINFFYHQNSQPNHHRRKH
jgi:hypothetical protein